MRLACDPVSVRKTLQHGVDAGYWTVEHLDRPSLGSEIFLAELSRNPDPNLRILAKRPHRNLLRESVPQERIEAGPSPRDFADTNEF